MADKNAKIDSKSAENTYTGVFGADELNLLYYFYFYFSHYFLYNILKGFYCAHTHSTHDFIAHIHIAHMILLRT